MDTPEIIVLILGIAAVIAVIVLTVSYICYYITFRRHGKGVGDPFKSFSDNGFGQFKDESHRLIKQICELPFEQIKIKSHDGLTLFARYYHVADSAPLEIQAHGYRGFARRDMSGGGLAAIGRGHNLLLIDQRAHDLSEGKTITFGIMERRDIAAWVDYAIERFGKDVRIQLTGVSMGAATVLMAAGEGLPENVRCVVADCPYSSPKEIIMRETGRMKLPPRIFFPFIRLGGLIFGRFDICAASPIEAVKSSTIPTILIHGEGDDFVPCDMSRRIFENCKMEKKKLATFPEATHGLSYFYDTERYMREVCSFTDQELLD